MTGDVKGESLDRQNAGMAAQGSAAPRRGLTGAQKAEAEREFKQENLAAFAFANAYIEEHGIPLSRFRRF